MCKLSQEEIQRPDFQEFIKEGEQSAIETNNITNYTLKTKNYKKMLASINP